MDVLDRLRLREDQKIVVAFDVAVEILEAFAAEGGFVELKPLDHRAHRAVEHENLVAGKRAELFGHWRCFFGHGITRLSAHRWDEFPKGG